jgi:hypothetical protein
MKTGRNVLLGTYGLSKRMLLDGYWTCLDCTALMNATLDWWGAVHFECILKYKINK